jgi:hypothetical protein
MGTPRRRAINIRMEKAKTAKRSAHLKVRVPVAFVLNTITTAAETRITVREICVDGKRSNAHAKSAAQSHHIRG